MFCLQACDDCCHMDDLDTYGPKEYEALATIKGMVREIDPWHLMFGTIACGEPWYWSEEGAGLGMDVMMKEGYVRHFLARFSPFGLL